MISTTRCGSAYSGSLKHLPLRIALCFLLLLSTSFSCKDSPSASENTKVTLTFEDASCIEAWLRLKVENATPPYSVALSRDGNTLAALNILTSDTLLIDEGLSPSTTYTYRASITLDNNIVVQSPDVPARTMDTSSHNWIFDPPGLLGDGSSSVLYDVAIISDSEAWAVGELFLNDSSGQLDPIRYNAARWDGNSWTVLRVPYYYQGQSFYHPVQAVFAFAPNDVWFAGNGVIRWDGQAYIPMAIPSSVWGPSRINKIWGSSGNNLYIVGDNGSIAHYDGTRWTRLESGTGLPIMDVYGATDQESGRYEILCISADQALPGNSQVLKIENTTVWEVATRPDWEPWAIWFVPQRRFMHAGDGLWETRSLGGMWLRNNNLPAQFKTSMDGQGLNDIMVGGAFWLLAHWNGLNWRTYFPRTSGSFTDVQMRNNLIVAVGGFDNRAVVVEGRR